MASGSFMVQKMVIIFPIPIFYRLINDDLLQEVTTNTWDTEIYTHTYYIVLFHLQVLQHIVRTFSKYYTLYKY